MKQHISHLLLLLVFLSLVLKQPVNRWTNIVLSIVFFLVNVVGLPTYPSWYDRFLIVVGLVFNVVTAWYALLAVPTGQIAALVAAMLINHEFKAIGVFRAIWYLPSVLAGVGMAGSSCRIPERGAGPITQVILPVTPPRVERRPSDAEKPATRAKTRTGRLFLRSKVRSRPAHGFAAS